MSDKNLKRFFGANLLVEFRTWRLSEAALPTDTHWSTSGTQQPWTKQLIQSLASIGTLLSYKELCPNSLGADGRLCGGNARSNKIVTSLFLLIS